MPTLLDLVRNVVRRGNYLVLDTETTGLGSDAQIVQIAVIDASGETLLDTLVSPTCDIPPDATHIHGITNDMVLSAPNWRSVHARVANLVMARNVIIYNASYDLRLLYQSDNAAGVQVLWERIMSPTCAMLAFAELYGDWNEYHQSYRWQTLEKAARYYGLPVNGAHSALGDCRLTLGVVKAMCCDG